MGAWGPGLYSDDTTCEVRDEYVSLLQSGTSGEEATDGILSGYEEVLNIPEIECLVILALAHTQWRYGRLEERIKSRALDILNRGADITVWRRDSPKDARKREKVLAKLQKTLESPPPPQRPIKLKKKRPPRLLFKGPVGSVLAVDLPNGKSSLLKVVGFHRGDTLIEPVFQLLDWQGDKIPTQEHVDSIAKHTLPVEDESMFAVWHIDGRKNPVSLFRNTGIVVQQNEVDCGGRYIGVNVELLPEHLQSTLSASSKTDS
jgi:hypothetical protein